VNIYLGDHFEKFIRDQVATGRYANASEVVREALRKMEENENKLVKLRAALQLGMDDLEAGQVTDWTPELMQTIVQEARMQVTARRKGIQPDDAATEGETQRAVAEGPAVYR
jgi:antitoxin ParD1/3/4